jgi:hypothetical protein
MLPDYLPALRVNMNMMHICLTSILMMMMATVAVPAQEMNASENNVTLNNTTSNADVNITTQNSTSMNVTNPDNISADSALNNASLFDAASNDSIINQTAKNLSIVNNKPLVAVPISEIAGIAPLVAAGASSAQASGKLDQAYKLGSGVGGVDPFNPEHVEIESLKLGLPIKPMRDTSRMFFVCDIV